MTPLDGHIVIVTGAGRGIGRATARLLAAQGASVVAASRTASELDQLVAAATRGGQSAMLPRPWRPEQP